MLHPLRSVFAACFDNDGVSSIFSVREGKAGKMKNRKNISALEMATAT